MVTSTGISGGTEPRNPVPGVPVGRRRAVWSRVLVAAAVVAALAAVYGALSHTGLLALMTDGNALRGHITALGPWGPLAVIALLSVAIVVSPLPSAPIALAAGVAYGHGWGALYVLIGSTLGALIAFTIAKAAGYAVLRRWLGDRLSLGLLGSQNVLMAIVFGSRLLPFLSFDLVSYAAGLTPLSTWRFLLATVAGIAPASFLLAHFGSELATADMRRVTLAVIGFGVLIAVPLVFKAISRRRSTAKLDRP